MSDEPTINPERVNEVFMDCLFREGEDTSQHVRAEGIVHTVGFHPGRLEEHRAEIEAWLAELPTEFRAREGGGWSFLNACNDRHGNQWTGLHQRMEQLFQLGIGLGLVACQMPRDMWAVLPGGMPYYVITDSQSTAPVL